jgi:hypothetical protein
LLTFGSLSEKTEGRMERNLLGIKYELFFPSAADTSRSDTYFGELRLMCAQTSNWSQHKMLLTFVQFNQS